MTAIRAREIHLKSRPSGLPALENFELAERDLPELKDGQMLVRNLWMSVDPYMRGRMVDRKSYVPPFQIGQALEGGAIGVVLESKHKDYKPGDHVSHFAGWRDHAVIGDMGVSKVDPNLAPLQAYLGTLGMPGLTAYAGILRIGQIKEGETVFVSAASGAVGSVVCQIAKNKGCYVAGSAGSDEKVKWLTDELGVDAAFNYKKEDNLAKAMAMACPKGIDVYFENVGGAHLDAALSLMNNFGRIPLCGMISQYNDTTPPPGPSNIVFAVMKSLRLEGFIVSHHLDLAPDFLRDMSQWISEGRMKWRETVVEGVENAPSAFIGLFKGENFGKMLVKIGDE